MTDCCNRPCIQNLSHHKPVISDEGGYRLEPIVNKLCLHCLTHWYGKPDNVKTYSKKEWETWINEP